VPPVGPQSARGGGAPGTRPGAWSRTRVRL